MSRRNNETLSLLRRLGEEKVVLPIRGGLSVSVLEFQAILIFVCCLICSCCSISSYVWGSVGRHYAESTPIRTSRPTQSPTFISPAAVHTPTSALTETLMSTSAPYSTETPMPAIPTPPVATATSQSPIPTPTLAASLTSTSLGAPVPTSTSQPAAATSTLTSVPTLTPTETLTPTSTPSPTPFPSDLHIAQVEHSPDNDLDEYVLIENRGTGSQDMACWTLSDEQSHYYFFPANFVLPGEDSVRVWTKSGKDTATDLHWGLDDPVWGNQGDTAYLAYLQDCVITVIDSLTW